MNLKDFLNNLMMGNASVINQENIYMLNQYALSIYNKEKLTQNEIEDLKNIIMSCNILYNRTDMTVLPIEDGFYDLLLEKYKIYDPNFQVGSAVVQFKNFIENDIDSQVATCPIKFIPKVERNEIRQVMYENIMRNPEPSIRDFAISPIQFTSEAISKRTHNTEHNHPSLVGTLDKAKFVFVKDAIDAGVENDPNVKILERDFFADHISKGIYDPNRIINVVAELKYDGISVEADCGLEVYSARTRGDTGIGVAADITPILKGYPFRHAGCMIGEKPIGVKFEAIITKSNLDIFNKLRGRDYKNCRTAIVGLFGSSDAYLFRDLITLIPLALDRDDIPAITNRMEEIEFLNKVFVSHREPLRYCYMRGTVQEVLYQIKAFWDEAKIARDHLNFMYDGIVISYLDEDIRQKLGRKNYINKYSMAVKFDPLEKQTIFRGYTYEVGQNGQITPMIHYDPVEFLGTIHNKSTGSSYQRFNELGLKYGDFINVKYVNDVMPYVDRCECDHNRKNTNPVEQFINKCPVCGSDLVLSESNKTIICPNLECSGRTIQRMVNMFAKLNIKGFADATFAILNKSHLYQLFEFDEETLINKLGVADGISFFKSLIILMEEPIPDYIAIGSLGFTGIAHKKWQSILEHITIKDLYEKYKSNNVTFLDNIPNIGTVTKQTIIQEFPFFEKDIECITHWKLINSFGKLNTSKAQIRFTGIRNKQLSELLIKNGYDADDNSSVTKKTDILLVPYEGFSSTKINKVRPDCKIIPIDEFINNMESYIGERLT